FDPGEHLLYPLDLESPTDGFPTQRLTEYDNFARPVAIDLGNRQRERRVTEYNKTVLPGGRLSHIDAHDRPETVAIIGNLLALSDRDCLCAFLDAHLASEAGYANAVVGIVQVESSARLRHNPAGSRNHDERSLPLFRQDKGCLAGDQLHLIDV